MTPEQFQEAVGRPFAPETMQRLADYVALAIKWNPRVNLVAKSTINDLWSRHIVDSAQLYACATGGRQRWLDLGSGGGFPGIVLAVLSMEDNPSARHVLVESDQRKAAFLREAIRVTGAPASVESCRIEALAPQKADVVTARALAALPQLLEFVAQHVSPEGMAILPKGAGFQQELDAARAIWRFDIDVLPSRTDPAGRLLRIEALRKIA